MEDRISNMDIRQDLIDNLIRVLLAIFVSMPEGTAQNLS